MGHKRWFDLDWATPRSYKTNIQLGNDCGTDLLLSTSGASGSNLTTQIHWFCCKNIQLTIQTYALFYHNNIQMIRLEPYDIWNWTSYLFNFNTFDGFING